MVTLFSFFVHEIPNGINDKANLHAKSLFWNTISMPLIVIKQLRIPPFTFPLSIIAFILIIFVIYISSICSICNFTCVSFRLLSQASFKLMSERSELHLLSKQGSATRTLRCKFFRKMLEALLLEFAAAYLAERLVELHWAAELVAV